MHNRLAAFTALLGMLALSACGGGGSGGYSTPVTGGTTTVVPPPAVAAQTIGLSLPSGFIGVVNDPTFGTIGGFTQTVYSQSLAFQTGTSVKIANLGSTNHTLNVVSTSAFPASGPATTAASGSSTIDASYASGPIAAGASITATLGAVGTYFLACAYHYLPAPQMRSALLVTAAPNPAPGPAATPGPTPPPGGGGGGGPCVGYYC